MPQTPKPSPLKGENIPAFFQQPGKTDGKQQKACEIVKMAGAGKGGTGNPEPLLSTEAQTITGRLDALETGLLAKFADLLQPISASLEQFNINLQKATEVAEAAKDLGVKNQGEIKILREADERQAEQLAIIGNRQRYLNSKFRGLDEQMGVGEDLNTHMTNWLADILNIDVNNVLLLTQSYRKEIMNGLMEANIRCSWATPLKLQIIYKRKPLFICSQEEGLEVLHLLNIPTPMITKKSQ